MFMASCITNLIHWSTTFTKLLGVQRRDEGHEGSTDLTPCLPYPAGCHCAISSQPRYSRYSSFTSFKSFFLRAGGGLNILLKDTLVGHVGCCRDHTSTFTISGRFALLSARASQTINDIMSWILIFNVWSRHEVWAGQCGHVVYKLKITSSSSWGTSMLTSWRRKAILGGWA